MKQSKLFEVGLMLYLDDVDGPRTPFGEKECCASDNIIQSL